MHRITGKPLKLSAEKTLRNLLKLGVGYASLSRAQTIPDLKFAKDSESAAKSGLALSFQGEICNFWNPAWSKATKSSQRSQIQR